MRRFGGGPKRRDRLRWAGIRAAGSRPAGGASMAYHATVRGERFNFADLRDLFAKANEEKSGDQLAGIAAATDRERVAAKLALAGVTLGEIVDRPLIDPDRD